MSLRTALLKDAKELGMIALKGTPGVNAMTHAVQLWQATTALDKSMKAIREETREIDEATLDSQKEALRRTRRNTIIAAAGNLLDTQVVERIGSAFGAHHHPVANFLFFAAGNVLASASGLIPGDEVFEPAVKKAWRGVQARFSHQVPPVQTLGLGPVRDWERLR